MIKHLKSKYLNYLTATWMIGLIMSLYLVFYYAPVDANMGISQKIFYVHLGSAAGMAVSVIIAFACSIIYLWKSSQAADDVASAAGQVAVALGAIVLLTGMTWAKAAWGTFLPLGEIKLLLFLMLWIVFVVYLILRSSLEPGHKRAAVSAVFAIMGFLLMPFVVMITRWFNFGFQLHPNVIRANDAGMPGPMLLTLLVSIAAWVLGAVVLVNLTARIIGIEHELAQRCK
jgi:heme exporter protein C